jgi:hypothetical protein
VHRTFRPLLVSLALLPAGAWRAGAELPPANVCPPVALAIPRDGKDAKVDAEAGGQFREGMVLTEKALMLLRPLLPDEIWQHRDTFFYEGMRMLLGGCHRRYPASVSYEEATQKYAGQAKVDDAGNLEGYVAGLPFPPESIDPAAPDAAVRWAWNLELRNRGSGPVGKFRLTDFPSRVGAIETYRGSFFLVQTGHRADLAATDHALPEVQDTQWVAGGRFDEPTNVRHLAWRQIRPVETQEEFEKADDTFVYVPTMRKPRRAATSWINGVFMPRYTVQADGGGSPIPFGASEYGVSGSISPNSGLSSAMSENMRRGFTGLALRPNAFEWKLLGERDVIAPLNGESLGYPQDPERNFGPSGLSVATDRWDVRHVVVIEGRARSERDDARRLTVYVDWQTQQPLYWISRRADGLLQDVGILVHRYSGDRVDYPAWPDGSRALVFDPVAAVFYTAEEGGTGWRRESYDMVSVPLPDQDVRGMTSTAALSQGR